MKLAMPFNRPRGRMICGAVCLALFFCLQLFASVPKLHNWLHSDSSESSHHCSLTMLTQGQVNTTVNEELVTVFIPLILPAVALASDKVVISDCRQLPPGRAPPLA